MSERNLVTGRVRSGPREGWLFVGVQGDPGSYERLRGGLTDTPTDVLVIGDDTACLDLIRILVETLLLEDSSEDLIAGIEALLSEATE